MYLPKIFKDNQKQAKESQQRIKVGKSQWLTIEQPSANYHSFLPWFF